MRTASLLLVAALGCGCASYPLARGSREILGRVGATELGLALLVVGGGVALGKWRRRKPREPTPSQIKEVPSSELSNLVRDGKEIQRKLDEIQGLLREIRSDNGTPALQEEKQARVVREEPVPPSLQRDIVGPGAEQSLLRVANRWWRDGGGRARLQELIEEAREYRFEFYVMERLDQGLGEGGNAYAFQKKDGTPEWLWYQVPGSGQAEFLAVPLDSRRFEGTVGALLPRLFEEVPAVPGYFRFAQVSRACRLRELAGRSGFYRPVSKGVLRIEAKEVPIEVPQSSKPAPVRLQVPQADAPAKDAQDLDSFLRQALEPQTRALEELRILLGERQKEARTVDLGTELRQIRDRMAAIESLLRAQSTPEPRRDDVPEPQSLAVPSPGMPFSPSSSPSPPRLSVGPEIETPTASRPSDKGRQEELLFRLRPVWGDLGQNLDPSPDSAQAGPGEAYLARLSALEEQARNLPTLSEWQVGMVHVRLGTTGVLGERSGISLHPLLGSVPLSGGAVRCSCGETLVKNMLFQLFLRLENPDADLCAVTLPAGPFAVSYFPAGYQWLLRGPLPTGPAKIENVLQPATLRRTGESYEVLSLLEATFR